MSTWSHSSLFNGSAAWSFAGISPDASLFLTKSFDLPKNNTVKIGYKIHIVSSSVVGANGFDGTVDIYFNGATTSRTLAASIDISDIVDGVDNSAVVDEFQFFAIDPSDHFDRIEIQVDVSTVDAETEFTVYIESFSVSLAVLDSNSKLIGNIRSSEDDVQYLFFYNTNPAKNCILKLEGDTLSNVLTWSGLDFSPNNRINGGGTAGNLLYFTDWRPRCVSLTRYANLTVDPEGEEEISLLRRGPKYAPTFTKYASNEGFQSTITFASGSQIDIADTPPTSTPTEGYLYVNNIEFRYTNRSGVTFTGVTPTPQDLSGTIYVGTRPAQDLVNRTNFQFAYYYEYEDKQESVLSPFSTLCAASKPGEDYRRVRVFLPPTESIPSLVKRIVFVRREGNAGVWLKITSVAPGTQFIDFYNTTNGNVVDPFQILPFSLVPRESKTMALAKSRLWLGNNLEGYNTPDEIDLSYTLGLTSGTPLVGGTSSSQYEVFRIYRTYWASDISGPTFSYVSYGGFERFIPRQFSDWATRSGKLDVLNDANPAEIAFRNIPMGYYSNINYSEITQQPTSFPAWRYQLESVGTVNVTEDTSSDSFAGQKTFPQASAYKLGIVFGDSLGRKSGVYTNDSLIVDTPAEFYKKISINWNLGSNDGIPSWADSYSIVLSKNLSKRLFIESYCVDAGYIKALDDTSVVYNPGVNASLYPYVRIDALNFPNINTSYSFVSGDRVILYVGANRYDMAINSFDGQFIYAKRVDLSETLVNNDRYLIEIYRPNTTPTEDIPFYEVGQVFPIVNGQFSVTSGVIDGDSINVEVDELEYSGSDLVKTGDTFAFKAMSVNIASGAWDTDAGRIYIETPVGEVRKQHSFRHSGTFVAGTALNFLSDFNVGDEGNIATESGQLMKLQSVHREATEGDLLLAISTTDTFSIYIDETRLSSANSSQLIGATKVIGDVRKQASGHGTLHPDSVHEENGYVYFYDYLDRSYCRYATNGIFPVSEYKAVRYFENISRENSRNDIVISGYDPFYKVVLVSFKNGGETKTIGFDTETNRWVGYFSFAPDAFLTGTRDMYSVVGPNIYKHDNDGAHGSFYGTDYSGSIRFPFNESPADNKDWKAIEIGCTPAIIEFSAGNQVLEEDSLEVDLLCENDQYTNILSEEFEVDSYNVYGEIRGNMNDEGGILYGEPLYGRILNCRITIRSADRSKVLYLTYAKAGFTPGRGHLL
jgi:hypothetical protein